MSVNAPRGVVYVSGLRDPIITCLRRLKTQRGRMKEGLFIAEGADLCQRVIKYGGHLSGLVCTEGFSSSPEGIALRAILPMHCPTYIASQGLIGKCLEAKPTPPCVGIVSRITSPWSEMISTQKTFFLGVDSGENADNLGMLLRSAEAAAVDAVLLGNSCVDPFGRRVVRASRGATFNVPLCIEPEMLTAVEHAKKSGIQIITTSANTTQNYVDVDYTRPTLIIVGNEHHGVSQSILAQSDQCVKIPMLGDINSLNISVAASLMIFEAQRQRGWRAHVD